MNDTRLIDLNELMALCGAGSPQAMLQWVKRNLAKINTDGSHAEKLGKGWLFDSVAVERILGLRKASSVVGVVSTTNEKQNALQVEIEGLRDKLLLAQGLVAQKQDNIIQLQAQLFDTTKLIASAETTKAQAEANATILQAEVDMLKAQVQELKLEKEKLLSIVGNAAEPKKKKKKRKKK